MNELNLKEAARLLLARLEASVPDSVERAEDIRDFTTDVAAEVLKEMGIPEEQHDDAVEDLVKAVRYVPEHYELSKKVYG